MEWAHKFFVLIMVVCKPLEVVGKAVLPARHMVTFELVPADAFFRVNWSKQRFEVCFFRTQNMSSINSNEFGKTDTTEVKGGGFQK